MLLLLGNWIRYGSTRSGPQGNFGGLMFGQILTGVAQPFVLAAPTRYSDLWFSNRGRVAATAVMSLANPFGGAVAQLVGPELANRPSEIPTMVLYISVIVRSGSFAYADSMLMRSRLRLHLCRPSLFHQRRRLQVQHLAPTRNRNYCPLYDFYSPPQNFI